MSKMSIIYVDAGGTLRLILCAISRAGLYGHVRRRCTVYVQAALDHALTRLVRVLVFWLVLYARTESSFKKPCGHALLPFRVVFMLYTHSVQSDKINTSVLVKHIIIFLCVVVLCVQLVGDDDNATSMRGIANTTSCHVL